MTGYLLWIAGGAASIAAFIAVDMWADRRPGGRKHDESLERLAAYERYLRALERQNNYRETK